MSPVDAELAADRIDELCACFITRVGSRLRSDPPYTLEIRTTDVDNAWVLTISPDAVTTDRHRYLDTDCAASGKAADMYLSLWNRTEPTELEVTGDRAVLDSFLDGARIRWT